MGTRMTPAFPILVYRIIFFVLFFCYNVYSLQIIVISYNLLFPRSLKNSIMSNRHDYNSTSKNSSKKSNLKKKIAINAIDYPIDVPMKEN